MRGLVIVTLLALAACAGTGRSGGGQPLAVRMEPVGNATRLTLTTAPGWKINARLKPALETAGGAILRFDGPHLSPDSAYFAEPPTTLVPGRLAAVHGTLRASVCAAGEQVCRVVEVEL